MKRAITVCAVILMGLVSCGAAPPIVSICSMGRDTKDTRVCGRGFTVQDSPYIITAGHVVKEDSILAIKTRHNIYSLYGYIVFVERKIDAAVIRTRATQPSGLPLCDPFVDKTEDVEIYTQDGKVMGQTIGATETDLFFMPEVRPGDSGSPIVSVKRQCVVGVVTGWQTHLKKDGTKAFLWSTAAPGNVLRWLIKEGDKFANGVMEKINETKNKVQPDTKK